MSECQHTWRWNAALQTIDCLKCGLIHITVTTAATATDGALTVATMAADAELSLGVAADDGAADALKRLSN